MARHNREVRGIDQTGSLWRIGYQPDWLSRIKISRQLLDGRRRSSLTLFRNPARRAGAAPGRVVRTEVRSADGNTRFRIAVEDPDQIVEEVIVVNPDFRLRGVSSNRQPRQRPWQVRSE